MHTVQPQLHVLSGACCPSPAAQHSGLSRAAAQADGYPMDDMTRGEVDSCMRGPAGSVAVLTIAGASADSPHRLVDLERQPLPQPPLHQVLGPAPCTRSLMPETSAALCFGSWPGLKPCLAQRALQAPGPPLLPDAALYSISAHLALLLAQLVMSLSNARVQNSRGHVPIVRPFSC